MRPVETAACTDMSPDQLQMVGGGVPADAFTAMSAAKTDVLVRAAMAATAIAGLRMFALVKSLIIHRFGRTAARLLPANN